MKTVTLILKSIINELLIIFLFIFLINNYIGNVDDTIKADGIGYYDYLPSIFIHHDLVRKDAPFRQDPIFYGRIESLQLYVDYGDYKINKYACGTAVLQLPFFACAYLTTTLEGNNNDGYQMPFQKAVFYATVFYLFLGIFFLKKLLEKFDIKRNTIILSQLLIVLATAVTNYANFDAGFSHVYSLFAITAFLYFTRAYFTGRNLNHFIMACLFLGLVIILRQINVLIVLFIPFLTSSLTTLKEGFINLLRNPEKLLIGILLISGVFCIQCILWYLQTGKFLIYSYQGEGFNFLEPRIIDILFSYKKGLFVYSPVLFISLLSLIWLAYKRKYYLVLTWASFFIVLTYVLSAWHVWYYGASYGMRVFIDYYAVFFIPFALMMDGLAKGLKAILIALSLLTIPVNIIQTYQYKAYILHWVHMDKEKYRKVFLKTDQRFKGMLWKKDIDSSNYYTIREYIIGDITASMSTDSVAYLGNSLEIPDFEHVSIIQVFIDNEYDDKNDSRIELGISDTSTKHKYYWHDPYLIRFSEKQLNEWQTGVYNYEFRPIKDKVDKIITLKVKSENQDIDLKNVRIKYLKHK